MQMVKTRLFLVLGVLALAVPGCYSGADAFESGDGDGDGGDGDGDGDGAEDGGPSGEELPAPEPRVYRMTHVQWTNTVRDLFGFAELPDIAGDFFRDDPKASGFVYDNDATALQVDDSLWNGYRGAATLVANMVIDDPAVFDALVPPDQGDPAARIDTFVRDYGFEAYRRPLTEDEVVELTDLFNDGAALYEGELDAFQAGVKHVIEATLQSPYFLYRVETSTEISGEVIPLSDFEMANRLSYFLWNSMPDDELFDAALAGDLTGKDSIALQTERMLDDPKAADVVQNFHGQFFSVDKYKTIAPNTEVYPLATANLADSAIEEHDRFVRDVVYGGGGGLRELLTSNVSYVNEDLAPIYGVEGDFGPEFQEVSLDPESRAGIFTRIGFLADNATSFGSDPIHRGAYLAQRIACIAIAAPPDGVPPLPGLEPGMTTRELVAGHTEQEGTDCRNCHATLINPYGFALEGYDGIGAVRTEDNGSPVDAASEPLLDGFVPVDGGVELSQAMAEAELVHQCYARNWLEYSRGRKSTPTDTVFIERLGQQSQGDNLSMRDIMVELTTSTAFRNRSTQEYSE